MVTIASSAIKNQRFPARDAEISGAVTRRAPSQLFSLEPWIGSEVGENHRKTIGKWWFNGI